MPVEADNAGGEQNLAEGTTVHLVDTLAGVDREGEVGGNVCDATTPDSFSGGVSAETDEQLRRRIIARMSDPPRGGAPGDYEAWAMEGGDDLAWERVGQSGPGTLDVYAMVKIPTSLTFGRSPQPRRWPPSRTTSTSTRR